MPSFKLRRPTLAEAFYGLSMGSTVVLLPLAGTYLRMGSLNPEINWVLMTVIWLAACATFAIKGQFLFKPPSK